MRLPVVPSTQTRLSANRLSPRRWPPYQSFVGVLERQVDVAGLLVDRHQRPDVGVAGVFPRIVLPGVDAEFVFLRDGVENPGGLAGARRRRPARRRAETSLYCGPSWIDEPTMTLPRDDRWRRHHVELRARPRAEWLLLRSTLPPSPNSVTALPVFTSMAHRWASCVAI